MQDFVVQCLIKDYQLRPSTDLLLRHEFLRTLPSEKNVRNQIREHTDRRKRVRHEEETEQELDVPDQEEEEDEGIDVNASGLSRNSNANPNAAAPPSNHLLQRPPSKYACALLSSLLRSFSFLSFFVYFRVLYLTLDSVECRRLLSLRQCTVHVKYTLKLREVSARRGAVY